MGSRFPEQVPDLLEFERRGKDLRAAARSISKTSPLEHDAYVQAWVDLLNSMDKPDSLELGTTIARVDIRQNGARKFFTAVQDIDSRTQGKTIREGSMCYYPTAAEAFVLLSAAYDVEVKTLLALHGLSEGQIRLTVVDDGHKYVISLQIVSVEEEG